MSGKLTIILQRHHPHRDAKKPYGFDVELNGCTHRGSRRWASAEARDKEVQRVALDFRSRGFTVEVAA